MASGERNELIIYSTQTDINPVTIQFDGDTMWLTQRQIAAIFNTGAENVRLHIRNIYAEGELDEESTSKKNLEVVENRPNYRVTVYNLDVVISVGYRVSSKVATEFRKWATQVIKERVVEAHGLNRDEQRLIISDRIVAANNELMKSAADIGVKKYVAFFDAGYRGMYMMPMSKLKEIKGIGNDRLLERAGVTELAANEFRITQTNAKLKALKQENRLTGQGVALATHFNVGREVRDAIERIGGTPPEDLPAEPDNIKDVRKRMIDTSGGKQTKLI